MDQLIHSFGIDAKLIIVQVINFVLLAAGLTYFLYKPVMKVLAERAAKIEQGIKDAEEAALAKGEADEKKKEILSEAHKAAEEVATHAKSFADEKAAGIVAAAEQQAVAVLSDAEAKRREMASQAVKESEAEVAKLAVLAAEKVLRERSS